MANRKRSLAVLSIRGTKQLEDWLMDMNATTMQVDGEKCHSGMLRSAKWIAQEGGMVEALKRLNDEGYTIKFVGHSLGAGVATMIALLFLRERRGVKLKVYGYGTPACVSEDVANKCMGDTPGFPEVISLVNRDDCVSRFSTVNIHALALEVQRQRLAVAVHPGVVNDQRILNAKLGVVNGGGIVCRHHVHALPVDKQAVSVVIHLDGAAELAVHGIVREQ